MGSTRKKQVPQSSSFFSVGECKQQENPSLESKTRQNNKTPAVVVSKPAEFHLYLKLPTVLQNMIFLFFNYKELPQLGVAHGRSYLRNSDIYPRVWQRLASAKSYTALSRDTLDAVPSAGPLDRQFGRIPLAGKLLNAVVDADYEQVAAMIVHDPLLMFEPVNFIYSDGSPKRISPLQYAFRVYDTYMWKLFYGSIKNNPDYVKQFLRQAREQTAHINLEPLFKAYQEYEKQCQRWDRDEITDQALDEAWFKIGKEQKKRLPAHMLKEFLREGDTWDARSAFDVNVTPTPQQYCQLYYYKTGGCTTLSWPLLDQEWGVSFSLGRGHRGRQVLRQPAFSWAVSTALDDLATLRRLFKVRTDDLAKGISQDFHETPKQQNQSLPLSI